MVRLEEKQKEEETKENIRTIEVPINLELINNKINYLINLIEKKIK